ncbi:hypothetical protein [Mesobacillus zeae]|uniref:hypothetical protein n=1 Tax=Mesobacillus zeae TaxID=1917180 RepID=UPI00300A3AB3
MLPHCYENRDSVMTFLNKAEAILPFLAFEPIIRAYREKDKMFKCVALLHMKNYFKKAAIAEKDFKELISLLDTFRDPYQEFLETRSYQAWAETKMNLLGGII